MTRSLLGFGTQHATPTDRKGGRIRAAVAAAALGLATLAAIPSTAAAQQPNFIGENGDWKAYTFKKGEQMVCYMASTPEKAEGDYTRRGRIYALVTNDPSAGVEGQFSVVTGYTYAAGSSVSVTIGGDRFELFTEDDKAWTRGPEEDARIVEAMIAGADMVIRGTSSRGTETTDTYSLIGFTATKRVIDQTCGG